MNGINDYFYILENFSQEDLEIVRQFYFDKIQPKHESISSNNKTDGMKVTYFQFTDDMITDAIIDLRNRYPMLSTNCLVYTSSLNGETGIHVDGDTPIGDNIENKNRLCAVNFPIAGCSVDSPTIFYGQYDDYESNYVSNLRISQIQSHQTPEEKTRISVHDKPVLINTKSWHNAINNVTEKRILFSWSCKFGVDFKTVRDTLIKENK